MCFLFQGILFIIASPCVRPEKGERRRNKLLWILWLVSCFLVLFMMHFAFLPFMIHIFYDHVKQVLWFLAKGPLSRPPALENHFSFKGVPFVCRALLEKGSKGFDTELDYDSGPGFLRTTKRLLRSRKIRAQLCIYGLIIHVEKQPNCIILGKRRRFLRKAVGMVKRIISLGMLIRERVLLFFAG